MSEGEELLYVFGIVAIIACVVLAIWLVWFYILWLRGILFGAHVGFLSIIGLKLRNVNPRVIVNARILANKAGLRIDTHDLEAHYLAHGHVERVVQAVIAAKESNLKLTFKRAAEIDLEGRDILEMVLARAKSEQGEFSGAPQR